MTTRAINDDPIARGQKRVRGLSLLPVLLLALAIPTGSAKANCNTTSPIIHGLSSSSFEQCGPSAAAFAWFHGRAVQRIIGPATTANTGNTASGHDSGPNQTLADSMMTPGPNGTPNGSYVGNSDFGNPGYDGCILNIAENPLSCAGLPDIGVLDYVIGGVDPSSPNVARIAVLSVDFNEVFLAHILDNAGPPSVDGDPCASDGFSFLTSPVNCTPIPPPVIVATNQIDFGTDVTVGIGDVSGIPMVDDCSIAETRSTNCPRNLYAGRALLFKHGACTPGTAATFDRRSYIYPAPPPSGTLAVMANWLTFSREDGNLNGVLDAGEDGSNGGTVNGMLDPWIIPGTEATTTQVFIPSVPGASDCIFLALGILFDGNHFAINPPTNTIFGEMVLSPVVSVNPSPLSITAPVPPADLITSLSATRSAGRVTVQWSTTNERMTQGFDVIGSKKSGKEFRLNSSLIPAQEGTTGQGATYSMIFDADLLKGASQVSVEIVLLDGSRKRFGPVPILTQRETTGG